MGRNLKRNIFRSFNNYRMGITKLKLKISRIRLKNGIRTCTIEPSLFLEQIAAQE